MNSTVKRKFNALIQGIGSRPSSERNPDVDGNFADLASSPASLRASPFPSRTMPSDLGSSSSSIDLLSKKRRVGAPASTPTKYGSLHDSPARSSPASIRSVPPTATTTTISNVTLRRWTPGSGAAAGGAAAAAGERDGASPSPPPKYCPGDRDQLIRRLATFQELTDWTPKPDRVSEIEWAKRGWVCRGKERVRCVLCAQELAVKVNRKEVDGREIAVLIASEIAESVVDRYAELIVQAHAEDCLWRKKGCDDSLLRLPLPNPKLALQGLRQRYDELCERSAFLPYESSLRLPPTLNLDTVISHLPPDFFTSPPPPPSHRTDKLNPTTEPPTSSTSTTAPPTTSTIINRSALALALFGWQSLTHPLLGTPVPNSASCHTCLRRLGLWLFRPRDTAADKDDDGGSPAPAPAPMDHLDPVREHRFFCPWKNPAAQRNPAARRNLLPPSASLSLGGRDGGGEKERDMAAWEVLVIGLRNEAFIREKVAGARGAGASSKTRTGTETGAGTAMGAGTHGRSKSAGVPALGTGIGSRTTEEEQAREAGMPPSTPDRRPVTAGGGRGGGVMEERENAEEDEGVREGEGEAVDDEEARKKKDLDMMSRLRRVKSLFNAKAGSKLRRLGGSRPGTSHSSVAGD